MDLWGEIGSTAGSIYTSFHGNGPTSMAAIKKKVKTNASTELAIGWLAREGKARVEKRGKSLTVEIIP